MNNFNVRITDDKDDLFIYPEATSVTIVDGNIEVAWEDGQAQHQMDQTDEITIKTNR